MPISLNEISFKFNHLRIDTSRIDKFIALADNEFEELAQSYQAELESGKFNSDLLFKASKAGNILFPIYSLGIAYCYSLIENNRKIIMKKIPGLSEAEIDSLYKIAARNNLGVTPILKKKVNIAHKNIANFKLAEEFRKVTNEIKHAAFSFSTQIVVEGEIYKADELRALYQKKNLLNDYLTDLNAKISSRL